MTKEIMLVAIGGALGSVGRFLVTKCMAATFPWGTLTVNLLGSLLIGLLVGLAGKSMLTPEMRLLLVTGLCGGFTTFSTFANESHGMLRTGDLMLAALYVGASVALGIVAVAAGMAVADAVGTALAEK